jgi:large subunit ribosomal protein L4
MRRNALCCALSEKIRGGKLICLDSMDLASPKTRELERALRDSLGVESRTLLLPLDSSTNLELAARNNPRLRVVRVLAVSIVDLLAHDAVIVAEDALARLEEVLAQ